MFVHFFGMSLGILNLSTCITKALTFSSNRYSSLNYILEIYNSNKIWKILELNKDG